MGSECIVMGKAPGTTEYRVYEIVPRVVGGELIYDAQDIDGFIDTDNNGKFSSGDIEIRFSHKGILECNPPRPAFPSFKFSKSQHGAGGLNINLREVGSINKEAAEKLLQDNDNDTIKCVTEGLAVYYSDRFMEEFMKTHPRVNASPTFPAKE